MKGNEQKYMLGEELALFTHHHRDWSLLPVAPSSRALSIERYYIWNACMHAFPLKPAPPPWWGHAPLTCCIPFEKTSSELLSDYRHIFLLMSPHPPFFDLCKYWTERRRAETPASSCRRRQDGGGPPRGRQAETRMWESRERWVKSLHSACTTVQSLLC